MQLQAFSNTSGIKANTEFGIPAKFATHFLISKEDELEGSRAMWWIVSMASSMRFLSTHIRRWITDCKMLSTFRFCCEISFWALWFAFSSKSAISFRSKLQSSCCEIPLTTCEMSSSAALLKLSHRINSSKARSHSLLIYITDITHPHS